MSHYALHYVTLQERLKIDVTYVFLFVVSPFWLKMCNAMPCHVV